MTGPGGSVVRQRSHLDKPRAPPLRLLDYDSPAVVRSRSVSLMMRQPGSSARSDKSQHFREGAEAAYQRQIRVASIDDEADSPVATRSQVFSSASSLGALADLQGEAPLVTEVAVAPDDVEEPLAVPTMLPPVFFEPPDSQKVERSSTHFLEQRDHVDRSNWKSRALEAHPEVREVKERVDPLHRALSLSSMFLPQRSNSRERLSRDVVYQLIMQHLHYDGLAAAQKAVESESQIPFSDPALGESRLVQLLRLALRNSERVYDLVIADRIESHAEQKLLNELYVLGFKEEEALQEDVDIWEEPVDSESNILFEPETPESVKRGLPPEIRAATVNKLVIRLTSEKHHDPFYMKTFMMTFQSFTSPDKLLHKLLRRYQVKRDAAAPMDDWQQRMQRPIQLRVCNVLKYWIEKHFRDFDESLISRVNQFIKTLHKDGHSNLARQLANNLQKRITGDGDRRTATFPGPPPDPKIPKNVFSPALDIFDVDDEEIARQLTLIEYEVFSAIQPAELLNQAWTTLKFKHRARNVTRMIARFNDLSSFVAWRILMENKIRARVRVTSRFIRVLEHLRSLNNYNSAMAVIAGLSNAAVHRLRFTRDELSRHHKEVLSDLERLMSSDSAFKNYREAIHSCNPPIIPYLGVYLTDLVFIEEGNPDKVEGLVNFSKRRLIYNVIQELQSYQQHAFNLQPVHQIQTLLKTFPECPDEDELYAISVRLEPRNSERSAIQ